MSCILFKDREVTIDPWGECTHGNVVDDTPDDAPFVQVNTANGIREVPYNAVEYGHYYRDERQALAEMVRQVASWILNHWANKPLDLSKTTPEELCANYRGLGCGSTVECYPFWLVSFMHGKTITSSKHTRDGEREEVDITRHVHAQLRLEIEKSKGQMTLF